MKLRTRMIGVIVLLAFWIGVVVLLATGSDLLLLSLLDEPPFPLGTPLTWAGIIAAPLLIWLAVPGFHPVRDAFHGLYLRLLWGLLLLAVSWGLVGYGLAGNWSFSFSGASPTFRASPAASRYFWNYTYFVALSPWAYLLVFQLHRWIRNRRGARLSKKK